MAVTMHKRQARRERCSTRNARRFAPTGKQCRIQCYAGSGDLPVPAIARQALHIQRYSGSLRLRSFGYRTG